MIPERLADQQGMRPLRIWSAGCASGAEPYSLAIVLADHFQPALANGRASILATDINRQALTQAHEGRFTDWELRRSEEHTSELQSLMRISYAVFCLKKKKKNKNTT